MARWSDLLLALHKKYSRPAWAPVVRVITVAAWVFAVLCAIVAHVAGR